MATIKLILKVDNLTIGGTPATKTEGEPTVTVSTPLGNMEMKGLVIKVESERSEKEALASTELTKAIFEGGFKLYARMLKLVRRFGPYFLFLWNEENKDVKKQVTDGAGPEKEPAAAEPDLNMHRVEQR